MKPVHLVLTVAFAIAALTVTVWIGKYQGKIAVVETKPAAKETESGGLLIPAEGPYGKAVATETSFDFGVLERGDKGSHVFIIKNEGPGPLRVLEGKTSCGQCTFGSVVPKDEDIPPGGTAQVEIKWEIKTLSQRFRQTADVHTTDPNAPKLTFAIEGYVDSPVHLTPDGVWAFGDLSESTPTVADGLLFSTMLDDLKIEKAECSNPLVNVTWEPANPTLLSEKHGKIGYQVKVAISPGTAVGPLRETVKLHTSARGGTVIEFSLTANRPGPIEIKGRNFTQENNVVRLGEFPATDGVKAKLMMYIRNYDGDFTAEQVESADSRAIVRVAKTGKAFGKSRVYEVEVEVPAGQPLMRRDKNAEPVVLKLNHPAVTELKMYVDYFAR